MSARLRLSVVTLLLSLVGLGAVAWHGATEASQPLPGAGATGPTRGDAAASTARFDPLAQRSSDVLQCSTAAPATPTPFNGATEGSPGPAGDPSPGHPADIASLPSGADAQERGVCVGGTSPTPVVAEAPLPVLLPLTAVGVLGGALWLARGPRHGPRRAARKEAADEG